MDTIGVNDASCIRCGRCVKVCPSQIFVQEKAGGDVTLHKPENCILCGHCVAACPTGAVNHAEFPAERVHAVCGRRFLTVTPGVRFADGERGDQKRVMTPAAAKAIGSDYIVVGRPITAAADPVAAYERCVAEFCD